MNLSRALLLVLCGCLSPALSSRILAVLPTPSRSHFVVFKPLLDALASRGHDLTVVSSFPLTSPTENYKDIDIRGFKNVYNDNVTLELLPHIPLSLPSSLTQFYQEVADFELVFSHPEVQRLLHSDERFDLVITEAWVTDLFLGFAHKFNAAVVVLSSCSVYPWHNDRFGNPDNPSYIPTNFLPTAAPLHFRSRLYNLFQLVVSKSVFHYFHNPFSEEIARRHFGESVPALDRLVKNISLVLVNTHHTIHGPRPLSPQVIEIGGVHIREPKPLPKDIEVWMNDSTYGVVYFSFGSILRGSSLPENKMNAFLEAFGSLPQRVLWKFEDDCERALPANVKIMKWIPQRDVLAHPKTRVFISHGGLLGMMEAVASGVPVLGIPMFAEQPLNVATMEGKGVAIGVDYNNISVASLSYALNTLLNDPGYQERTRQLSARFLDRPMSPLDTAVYWVEYVLRHRGAPHLQSAALHLSWFQRSLLDVAAVYVSSLAVLVATAYYFLRLCIIRVVSITSVKLKTH